MLNQDFREFIQSLNDNNVRYLIVGGYAVAIHGYPRHTKDIDFWIEINPENAANMVKALHQFGFASLGLQEADFLIEDQIIQLGYPPNRIDLITSMPGIQFGECFQSRVQVEIDGLLANFIDLENLKKNKRTVARKQDLADLERLEE